MAEHRYAVGSFAVVVDDEDEEEVGFETATGDVLARLSWDEVSELQRALVTAEEGETRRRRHADEESSHALDGSDERAASHYEPLTPDALNGDAPGGAT